MSQVVVDAEVFDRLKPLLVRNKLIASNAESNRREKQKRLKANKQTKV